MGEADIGDSGHCLWRAKVGINVIRKKLVCTCLWGKMLPTKVGKIRPRTPGADLVEGGGGGGGHQRTFGAVTINSD